MIRFEKNPCGACNVIYESEDEYRKYDPLCNGTGLMIDECGDIMFYVPSKDPCHDSSFIINYCMKCGRDLHKSYEFKE